MKTFLGVAIGLLSVIGFISSAEAITITFAEVQNGVAVVQGNKAEKSAIITWDGISVTQGWLRLPHDSPITITGRSRII